MTKWQRLNAALNAESDLLTPRITAQELETMVVQGLAARVEIDDIIIAFAALWPTPDPAWRELGAVWVHPAHRGKKLGSNVFRELLSLAEALQCFLITHNPRIVHLAKAAGWQEMTSTTWSTTVPWPISCGVCDRWETDEERHACPLRAVPTECRLFHP